MRSPTFAPRSRSESLCCGEGLTGGIAARAGAAPRKSVQAPSTLAVPRTRVRLKDTEVLLCLHRADGVVTKVSRPPATTFCCSVSLSRMWRGTTFFDVVSMSGGAHPRAESPRHPHRADSRSAVAAREHRRNTGDAFSRLTEGHGTPAPGEENTHGERRQCPEDHALSHRGTGAGDHASRRVHAAGR